MKIINNDSKQWYIHFYDSFYSNPLYKNYNSIKELCDDLDVKRYEFELYYNIGR